MDSILRNQLQVFLCHASEDKSAIRGLYSNLRGDGFAPWLDEEHLLPGEDFDLRIRETVRTSDVVLACLSKKTITKSGYIQKELRYALDIADEQPEGAVYIIPVRLEQCKVPERLRKWQWVDLFTKDGYSQLIRTLETRARAKFAVNPTGKLDVSHSFALDQLHIETSSKVLAAKWVVQNMELKVGAGVFLDAGSSCLAVWHALREREIAHLHVLTNNFLILEDWSKNLHIPWYRSVHMELFGSVFDGPHMAFYEPRDAGSLSQFVRPSLVCVGTVGVEFTKKGGILIGYHSGKPERAAKELWFQVPCSGARVILVSPAKVGRGRAGGFVLDILGISDLDVGVPICLVTAAPALDSPDASRFSDAVRALHDDRLQQSLAEKGVDFHMIIVNSGNDGVPRVIEMVPSAHGTSKVAPRRRPPA